MRRAVVNSRIKVVVVRGAAGNSLRPDGGGYKQPRTAKKKPGSPDGHSNGILGSSLALTPYRSMTWALGLSAPARPLGECGPPQTDSTIAPRTVLVVLFRPVVAVADAVRVELEAIAWRDGLKGK